MAVPRLFDTHCHPQLAAYREDGDAVIRAALDAGTWIVAVGTEAASSAAAVACAERYPEGVSAAIGLHPSHLAESRHDDQESETPSAPERFDAGRYAAFARSPKVVAVGECGMDLSRPPEGTDVDALAALQEEQLRLQIAFADEQDLPIIVHCRDAHDRVAAILAETVAAGGCRRRGVIHSFTGTWDEAARYADLGFRIGVNGIVTFPPRKSDPAPHEALLDAVRRIPEELLLLETDAPYLSPVPHRGERNLPTHVAAVAEKVAELRGVTLQHVARTTTANALALFLRIPR